MALQKVEHRKELVKSDSRNLFRWICGFVYIVIDKHLRLFGIAISVFLVTYHCSVFEVFMYFLQLLFCILKFTFSVKKLEF